MPHTSRHAIAHTSRCAIALASRHAIAHASRCASGLALAAFALTAGACSHSGPSAGAAGERSGAQAAAPSILSPSADAALIEWHRAAANSGGLASRVSPASAPPAAAPRERVTIGLGGLWIGPENPQDGPRVHYLFARRRRGDELADLARSFAPFRLPAGGEGREQDGELSFHGRGTAAASPAERRMIAEWTRAVEVESAGEGGRPSLYGLAFTWHRGAVAGGVCDDLSVYLSGEVSAGSCGAGAEAGGRLTEARLQRLYGWVDGLTSFQDAGEQGVRADALLERLIFAGRGRRPATREDVAAIEAFAATLHHEIAAPGAPATAGAAAAPERAPAGPRSRPAASGPRPAADGASGPPVSKPPPSEPPPPGPPPPAAAGE